MAKSTHAVKRAIIAHLEQSATATVGEIAEALGGKWLGPEKRVLLRQMLRRMVAQYLLKCPSHGVYGLSADYEDRGLDSKDGTENDIEEFLRSQGGIAETSEIHAELWGWTRGDPDGAYSRKRITIALTESPRFRQDFGRGVWNLMPEELERLPRLGRWASLHIKRHWDPVWSVFPHWFDQREDWFRGVGAAFAVARGDLNLGRLTAMPAIKDALDQMAPVGSVARNAAYRDLRATLLAQGVPEGQALDIAVHRCRDTELPRMIYEAFEEGSTNLHLAAPVEFYTACALVFGVCPAKLSRGVVERVAVEA